MESLNNPTPYLLVRAVSFLFSIKMRSSNFLFTQSKILQKFFIVEDTSPNMAKHKISSLPLSAAIKIFEAHTNESDVSCYSLTLSTYKSEFLILYLEL